MKKLLLLLLLTTGIASAQIVNIPDANFKAELIADGVDTNMDGEIQTSEALATTSISLQSSTIVSVDGIEAFINLENFESEPNQVATLDFSSNVNLLVVDIQAAIPPNAGPLSSIDVSSCPLLEEFSVYSSSILTLDLNSNSNLTYLRCVNNHLMESVFIKNGSDESLNVGAGSWSENWFQTNNLSLSYVCADEFQVVEIQQFAGPEYPVNSFCTFPPGGDINTITGVTKFDDENNGCDSGDASIPYTSFNIEYNGSPTNAIAYSNANGIYNVYAGQAGTYTLFPNLENPTYFNISPSPATVAIPVINNSTVTQDFCVVSIGTQQDLEVVIAPITPAAPGFQSRYHLVYKNNGNVAVSGDVQFNYPGDLMEFVSSSIMPDTQSAGLLTYNFTNLQPYETVVSEIILEVNTPTDTPPVNIDDVLVLFTEINPVDGDENPANNYFTLDQIVVGSFDPNNVVCIQGDEVPSTYIGEYLHYVINFENTGTAPAENIVVTMEIDPTDFNPTSMQILNASHDMEAIVIDNVAQFHFQNISLDTGGHGNILLKMKTNEDLITTDEVGLQANIYFDFNFPVATNEAVTSFRVLGVDEFDISQIKVYPNPANDVVNVQSPSVIKSITVYDLQGRLIVAVNPNKQNSELNISHLNTGIYFFSIETEAGTMVRKIMKQ